MKKSNSIRSIKGPNIENSYVISLKTPTNKLLGTLKVESDSKIYELNVYFSDDPGEKAYQFCMENQLNYHMLEMIKRKIEVFKQSKAGINLNPNTTKIHNKKRIIINNNRRSGLVYKEGNQRLKRIKTDNKIPYNNFINRKASSFKGIPISSLTIPKQKATKSIPKSSHNSVFSRLYNDSKYKNIVNKRPCHFSKGKNKGLLSYFGNKSNYSGNYSNILSANYLDTNNNSVKKKDNESNYYSLGLGSEYDNIYGKCTIVNNKSNCNSNRNEYKNAINKRSLNPVSNPDEYFSLVLEKARQKPQNKSFLTPKYQKMHKNSTIFSTMETSPIEQSIFSSKHYKEEKYRPLIQKRKMEVRNELYIEVENSGDNRQDPQYKNINCLEGNVGNVYDLVSDKEGYCTEDDNNEENTADNNKNYNNIICYNNSDTGKSDIKNRTFSALFFTLSNGNNVLNKHTLCESYVGTVIKNIIKDLIFYIKNEELCFSLEEFCSVMEEIYNVLNEQNKSVLLTEFNNRNNNQNNTITNHKQEYLNKYLNKSYNNIKH